MTYLLLLILAHVICLAAYLPIMMLLGRIAKVPIEEVGLFNGRTLIRLEIGGVTYRLNWLPIGSYVKFDAVYMSIPLASRLMLNVGGLALYFLIAVVCLSFDAAKERFGNGFEQIVTGAIWPLSKGKAFTHSMFDFVQSHAFVTILGATAAKECAFNSLPLPPLGGGYALLAIAEAIFPITERSRYRVVLTGFLLLFALLVGWTVAVTAAVISS